MAACVASAGVSPAGAEASDDLFDRYEILLGDAEHQTVAEGFFLGGPVAQLAAVDVSSGGDRHLRLYALADGAWSPVLEAGLGDGVSFVDVTEIGGRDRLITFDGGQVSWFDPESATERPLVEVPVAFKPGDEPGIPRVDITRDLNRDGRDDVVVPDVDGFWISTQASDGSFAEAVKLGPPEPFRDALVGRLDTGEKGGEKARTYGDVGITAHSVPIYLGRIHQLDYDRDGRSDLVFWNEDHFDVHLQDERGGFDPVAVTFSVDVPFDSEGAYSRAFDYRDQGVFSIVFGVGKKTRRTVLHSFQDLDGDGVADLVTLTLEGRTIASQRSTYEVHFGTATDDGIAFAREVGAAIRPRGRAGGMEPWGYASRQFRDLDGDGRIDVLFRDLRSGMGGMMRALVGNSVPLNLEVFRMEDGAYPERASVARKIRRFAPFNGLGNVFFPPVLVGDVNGDGRSDLLVGQSPQELHVFFGVPGPDLLARQPQKVAVALPPDERNTRLADLDGDGRQDVVIQRGPTGRAPDQPHRLTILIAR